MKKCLKVMTSLVLSVSLIVNMSCMVFADSEKTDSFNTTTVLKSESTSNEKNGWYKKGGDYYYYDNGNIVKNRTKKIDGKIYLFGSNGKLLANGIYTVNESKYSVNEDGTVMCNKWVKKKSTSASTTYYYAKSNGKITEYTFKIVEKTSTGLSTYGYLYIDGKRATKEDIKEINTKDKYVQDGFYRFNNDYYFIQVFGGNLRTACGLTADIMDLRIDSYYMYDFGSKKYLGKYYGRLKANSKGIAYGNLYNVDDGCVYKINDNGKKFSKSKAADLVVFENSVKVDTAGGVDYKLGVVNNSSKTIKYIDYDVYVNNAVGDSIRCDITGKKIFGLRDTGPYEYGGLSYGTFSNIMYNNSAKKVIISSVRIEYMDGTYITISGNNLTYLK